VNHRTAMLEGRAALIVGLDDIGVGIAARFRREGAQVTLLDLEDPPRARRASGGLPGAQFIANEPLDLCAASSNIAAVSQSIRSLGVLDILVCNLLPPPRPGALETLQPADLDQAFARVRATLAILQAALPALRDSGRGRIVLIGHRYGETVNEALGAYNAAALGLIGLARTAAVEWG
jgi:NAD(P)-dependent dehydrogenase (short-subunit alcohol dehydrogenase family)